MKKKIVSLLLICLLIVSVTFNSTVFAYGNEIPDDSDSVTKVDKGNFYDNSDSWFKEQAHQRLLSGYVLDDMPW